MRTIKEHVFDLETEYKKRCAKEISEFKNNKRKSCTTKVNYLYPFTEVEILYNERNDNDDLWFNDLVRNKK